MLNSIKVIFIGSLFLAVGFFMSYVDSSHFVLDNSAYAFDYLFILLLAISFIISLLVFIFEKNYLNFLINSILTNAVLFFMFYFYVALAIFRNPYFYTDAIQLRSNLNLKKIWTSSDYVSAVEALWPSIVPDLSLNLNQFLTSYPTPDFFSVKELICQMRLFADAQRQLLIAHQPIKGMGWSGFLENFNSYLVNGFSVVFSFCQTHPQIVIGIGCVVMVGSFAFQKLFDVGNLMGATKEIINATFAQVHSGALKIQTLSLEGTRLNDVMQNYVVPTLNKTIQSVDSIIPNISALKEAIKGLKEVAIKHSAFIAEQTALNTKFQVLHYQTIHCLHQVLDVVFKVHSKNPNITVEHKKALMVYLHGELTRLSGFFNGWFTTDNISFLQNLPQPPTLNVASPLASAGHNWGSTGYILGGSSLQSNLIQSYEFFNIDFVFSFFLGLLLFFSIFSLFTFFKPKLFVSMLGVQSLSVPQRAGGSLNTTPDITPTVSPIGSPRPVDASLTVDLLEDFDGADFWSSLNGSSISLPIPSESVVLVSPFESAFQNIENSINSIQTPVVESSLNTNTISMSSEEAQTQLITNQESLLTLNEQVAESLQQIENIVSTELANFNTATDAASSGFGWFSRLSSYLPCSPFNAAYVFGGTLIAGGIVYAIYKLSRDGQTVSIFVQQQPAIQSVASNIQGNIDPLAIEIQAGSFTGPSVRLTASALKSFFSWLKE